MRDFPKEHSKSSKNQGKDIRDADISDRATQ